ncbi:Rv3654c family TadE-like protein [Myceligenerans salitolerans]|uniref:D-alanyl-D-alanine carboxypeptidase family protein n=1 Tax=Myceligenerans salitolerans TaxID=1230528 RepID=A0ABS3I9I5_9MICO|nr:Rv3654c family TadE-like protein [Myceligenerans salitolerans]MBO0609623.1 D-alanyl-D-alanine carboxypeptidase family protein [Myceligenerans salitolerans]
MSRRASERGAGSVLVLGVIGTVLVLTTGLAALGAAQNSRGVAQTAADLGALAGATAFQAGLDPCAKASSAVVRNGARAASCRVEAAGAVRVEARRPVALPGGLSALGTARADARAGPRTGPAGEERAEGTTAVPGRAAALADAAARHANGRIPRHLLCELSFAADHRLRCDAAVAIERLDVAFRAAFGRGLAVRGSYRSYEAQVAVAASKGSLAAPPGTSNHGWGQAVDLGGGIQYFGTAEYAWMVANAGAYGWVRPGWAAPGGSKPEPWHWEYGTGA